MAGEGKNQQSFEILESYGKLGSLEQWAVKAGAVLWILVLLMSANNFANKAAIARPEQPVCHGAATQEKLLYQEKFYAGRNQLQYQQIAQPVQMPVQQKFSSCNQDLQQPAGCQLGLLARQPVYVRRQASEGVGALSGDNTFRVDNLSDLNRLTREVPQGYLPYRTAQN